MLVGAARDAAPRVIAKKKTFTALERDTPERRAYRRTYCKWLLTTLSSRLVFIDESACKTGMRREFGSSVCGERAFGKRMGASWKTLSVIGAIRLGERPRLMTHRGAINGTVFLHFVRTRLVPSLHIGDIVVIDNLRRTR